MNSRLRSAKRKKGGRPATGTDPFVGLRVPLRLIKRINAWASDKGVKSRSEAIRRLVEKALPPAAPKQTRFHGKKMAQAAKLAEEQVERLIDPALPPEARELSKRRLIKGPREFLDIRDRKGKREKRRPSAGHVK
jgi:hypothetical protein